MSDRTAAGASIRTMSGRGGATRTAAAPAATTTSTRSATADQGSETWRTTSPRSSSSTTRSEEHTSELQSLMRISYAVFCLKKKKYLTNYKCTTSKYNQENQPN